MSMYPSSFTKPAKSIKNSSRYSPIYSVIKCHSDDISKAILDDLCKFVEKQQQEHPEHPALANMTVQSESGLLFNIIQKKRWNSNIGEIAILYHGNDVVGVSCVEHWDQYPQLTIGGIRCWLDKHHRTDQQMSQYLLAANLEWSVRFRAVGMLMSFNDYNKIIYDAIQRKTNGKTVSFNKIWSNWWDDCMIIEKPLCIRYTNQWCVIKPINAKECNSIYKKLGI
jgi:hypothetical protein